MSKSEGKRIAIKFTEDLVGDVGGGIESVFYLPSGVVTASDQYSSYAPIRAFQDNNDYWYTRIAPVWIQIELAEPVYIKGFRWNTKTSSHRPKDFTVQGSNDGVDWDDLFAGESLAENGWKDFSWAAKEEYRLYRWDISTKWSSYIYIYQIELIGASGNLDAFSVSGKEYLYVQGLDCNSKLINRDYTPINVEKHPTVDKAILLGFSNTEKFNNVVGDLNVKYSSRIGNLSGRGGRVEDFAVVLAPSGLIPTPNPGITETISVAPVEIIGDLLEIEYPTRYSKHGTITVAPVEVTGELISIDEVNP